MIYDGKKWQLKESADEIGKLLLNNEDFIEKIDEWVDTNEYPEAKEKFYKYLDKRDDDEFSDQVKQKIKLELYNSRDNKRPLMIYVQQLLN